MATKVKGYTLKDLHGAALKLARREPVAWTLFKKQMRGWYYGQEPLIDAWLWFLKGYCAHRGGDACENRKKR